MAPSGAPLFAGAAAALAAFLPASFTVDFRDCTCALSAPSSEEVSALTRSGASALASGSSTGSTASSASCTISVAEPAARAGSIAPSTPASTENATVPAATMRFSAPPSTSSLSSERFAAARAPRGAPLALFVLFIVCSSIARARVLHRQSLHIPRRSLQPPRAIARRPDRARVVLAVRSSRRIRSKRRRWRAIARRSRRRSRARAAVARTLVAIARDATADFIASSFARDIARGLVPTTRRAPPLERGRSSIAPDDIRRVFAIRNGSHRLTECTYKNSKRRVFFAISRDGRPRAPIGTRRDARARARGARRATTTPDARARDRGLIRARECGATRA